MNYKKKKPSQSHINNLTISLSLHFQCLFMQNAWWRKWIHTVKWADIILPVVVREAELWANTRRVKEYRRTCPVGERFVVVVAMFCIWKQNTNVWRQKKQIWMWNRIKSQRWEIQRTSAISDWLCCGIIWVFWPYWTWSTFDPLTSLCGWIVFVAVHWQILCELHMLLSLDGGSFAGPRQSL